MGFVDRSKRWKLDDIRFSPGGFESKAWKGYREVLCRRFRAPKVLVKTDKVPRARTVPVLLMTIYGH
jgi:hypothetical protein